MTIAPAASHEFLLYTTEDGHTRIQCRFQNDRLWLTQAQIAELFQTSVPNINQHLKAIYAEGELDEEATIKSYLIVRQEGPREVSRPVKHYDVPAIVAVGFRVRGNRGTQFRQWAIEQLRSYLVKGFVINDDQLKNPSAPDQNSYFDELLARIRDIRSSEKVFWRKVLDIYATSIDYDPKPEASKRFFQTVQNKMHWAAHGHTAAELIVSRADAAQPNMGLTSWRGDRPRKSDIRSAKNYLNAEELEALNRIVTAYLEFAELQAINRRPMHMADWISKLDDFLKLADHEILTHAGKVSSKQANRKADSEYERFEKSRAQLPTAVETHFTEAITKSKEIKKARRQELSRDKKDG